MRIHEFVLRLAPSVFFWACSTDPGSGDAGTDASTPDSGTIDAGARDGGSSDGGVPDDPFVKCGAGETAQIYKLTTPANLPGTGALEFTNLIQGTQIVAAGADGRNEVRFDVCARSGHAELRGLLYAEEPLFGPQYFRIDPSASTVIEEFVPTSRGSIIDVRMPPGAFLVEGLDAAIAGDLDPLSVRLVYENGLLLLGHPGFVALARGRVTASAIEYTSIFVVAGGFAAGDPFANRRCAFGESFLAKTFRLDTASFSVEACTFLGSGITTGYRFTRMTIEDSNAALSAAERAPVELDDEAALAPVLEYRYNHHNGCDSFHLTLPHADYAATTSPAAGCGQAVSEAPMRSFDETGDIPVKYRVRYHQGAWTEGTMPGCHHYLFCE